MTGLTLSCLTVDSGTVRVRVQRTVSEKQQFSAASESNEAIQSHPVLFPALFIKILCTYSYLKSAKVTKLIPFMYQGDLISGLGEAGALI